VLSPFKNDRSLSKTGHKWPNGEDRWEDGDC
jgi:hypothetical protein